MQLVVISVVNDRGCLQYPGTDRTDEKQVASTGLTIPFVNRKRTSSTVIGAPLFQKIDSDLWVINQNEGFTQKAEVYNPPCDFYEYSRL